MVTIGVGRARWYPGIARNLSWGNWWPGYIDAFLHNKKNKNKNILCMAMGSLPQILFPVPKGTSWELCKTGNEAWSGSSSILYSQRGRLVQWAVATHMCDQMRGSIMEVVVGRKRIRIILCVAWELREQPERVKWDTAGEKVVKDVLLKIAAS